MPAVTVEDRGAISIIRINRPERLNAIGQAVAVEMQQAFKTFDANPDKRVAILSATGSRAFSSGADVNDLPELWRAIPNVGFRTDKPIIAATSGWVIGGAIVMVMMCDLLVSTQDTQFYYPEAKLGTTAGGISSLAARMPHHLAMEIMLLGSKIPAQRAYDVGFVNRVVPNGEHEAEALAMARRLPRDQNHPNVATILNNMGGAYQALGDARHGEELAGYCRRLEFLPGDVIARQGDAADTMHFILEGRIGVIVAQGAHRAVRATAVDRPRMVAYELLRSIDDHLRGVDAVGDAQPLAVAGLAIGVLA